MPELSKNYFKCSCGSEVLHVNGEADAVEISIYSLDPRMGFLNKLRHAWRTLRGRHYSDQIILDKKEVANLVDELVKIQNN